MLSSYINITESPHSGTKENGILEPPSIILFDSFGINSMLLMEIATLLSVWLLIVIVMDGLSKPSESVHDWNNITFPIINNTKKNVRRIYFIFKILFLYSYQ